MKRYFHQVFAILGGPPRAFAWLIPLFLASSLLDFIGIGLIGPFIMAVATPERLEGKRAWELFESILGVETQVGGLIALGVAVIVVFYGKTIATYLVQRAILRFGLGEQMRLRSRLMKAYLYVPYEFHLARNSSTLVQSLLENVGAFTEHTLINWLRIIADGCVFIAIFALLSYASWFAMVVMLGFLAILFAVYYGYVRRRIARAGEVMTDSGGRMIRGINHGVGGIKEVRVLGRESHFLEEVEREVVRYADAIGDFRLLSLVPRYLIESAMVTFVVGLAILALRLEGGTTRVLPTLGMFGVAGIRLLPSATMLLSSINGLRLSRHIVGLLYHDLREVEGVKLERTTPDREAAPRPFETLRLEQASYRYPGATGEALDGLSIEVRKGESVGLIGPSGAGKTTVVDVLLGFLVPQEGDVTLDGISIHADLRGWLDHVAYIPQTVFLTDDTLRRNVALGFDESGIDSERLQQALQAAQLDEVVRRLPNGVDTMLGEDGVRLSGGQRQRVALARAFYHGRDVLILDEATSALDNETEREIIQAIDALKGKKTMIVIAHRLSTVAHCDVIYRLEDGKVVNRGTYERVVGA